MYEVRLGRFYIAFISKGGSRKCRVTKNASAEHTVGMQARCAAAPYWARGPRKDSQTSSGLRHSASMCLCASTGVKGSLTAKG